MNALSLPDKLFGKPVDGSLDEMLKQDPSLPESVGVQESRNAGGGYVWLSANPVNFSSALQLALDKGTTLWTADEAAAARIAGGVNPVDPVLTESLLTSTLVAYDKTHAYVYDIPLDRYRSVMDGSANPDWLLGKSSPFAKEILSFAKKAGRTFTLNQVTNDEAVTTGPIPPTGFGGHTKIKAILPIQAEAYSGYLAAYEVRSVDIWTLSQEDLADDATDHLRILGVDLGGVVFRSNSVNLSADDLLCKTEGGLYVTGRAAGVIAAQKASAGNRGAP